MNRRALAALGVLLVAGGAGYWFGRPDARSPRCIDRRYRDCGKAAVYAPVSAGHTPLLSILPGGPSSTCTGSLTAATGQTVSASRSASAYCLGDDGLLHYLGPNTVRVEPLGVLREPASTNYLKRSKVGDNIVGGDFWTLVNNASPCVVTLDSTDVLDPEGLNHATKLVVPSVTSSDYALLGGAFTPTPGAGINSIWMRVVSGTAQVTFSGNDYANIVTVTSTWQRFTFPQASIGQFWLGWHGGIVGAKPGVTVYAWHAQAEPLPYATSPIKTAGAVVTRPADRITVANPLASLNPGTWSFGARLIPLGTWAQVNEAPSILLALGDNATANTAVIGQGFSGVSTEANYRIIDSGGGQRAVVVSGAFSGAAPVSISGKSTAGVLSTSPTGGSPSGAGNGTIATQPATLTIGCPGATPDNFAFKGWMTDIVVDSQ